VEAGEMLPNDFIRAIAFDALPSRIPSSHVTVDGLHEEGVIGHAPQQQGKQARLIVECGRLLHALPCNGDRIYQYAVDRPGSRRIRNGRPQCHRAGLTARKLGSQSPTPEETQAMTEPREHLLHWLRDAHAMEQQAERMLKAQASRIENYPAMK